MAIVDNFNTRDDWKNEGTSNTDSFWHAII